LPGRARARRHHHRIDALDRPSHPGFRLGRSGHPCKCTLRPLRACCLHVSGVTFEPPGPSVHPWPSGSIDSSADREHAAVPHESHSADRRNRAVPALAGFRCGVHRAADHCRHRVGARDSSRARLLRTCSACIAFAGTISTAPWRRSSGPGAPRFGGPFFTPNTSRRRAAACDLHYRLACRSALVLPSAWSHRDRRGDALLRWSGVTYATIRSCRPRRVAREIERTASPPLPHAAPRLRAATGDARRHAPVRRRVAPRN